MRSKNTDLMNEIKKFANLLMLTTQMNILGN